MGNESSHSSSPAGDAKVPQPAAFVDGATMTVLIRGAAGTGKTSLCHLVRSHGTQSVVMGESAPARVSEFDIPLETGEQVLVRLIDSSAQDRSATEHYQQANLVLLTVDPCRIDTLHFAQAAASHVPPECDLAIVLNFRDRFQQWEPGVAREAQSFVELLKRKTPVVVVHSCLREDNCFGLSELRLLFAASVQARLEAVARQQIRALQIRTLQLQQGRAGHLLKLDEAVSKQDYNAFAVSRRESGIAAGAFAQVSRPAGLAPPLPPRAGVARAAVFAGQEAARAAEAAARSGELALPSVDWDFSMRRDAAAATRLTGRPQPSPADPLPRPPRALQPAGGPQTPPPTQSPAPLSSAAALAEADTVWLQRSSLPSFASRSAELLDVAQTDVTLQYDVLWRRARLLVARCKIEHPRDDAKCRLMGGQARELCEKAVALRGQQPATEARAWLIMAINQWRRGRGRLELASLPSLLKEQCAEIIKHDPGYLLAVAYRTLGRLHCVAPWPIGDTNVSETELRTAVRLAPASLLNAVFLADTLIQLRWRPEAEQLVAGVCAALSAGRVPAEEDADDVHQELAAVQASLKKGLCWLAGKMAQAERR